MKLIAELITYQLFDWTSPDGETQIQFQVTSMLDAIDNKTLDVGRVRAVTDYAWAKEWLPKRDLNLNHVLKITKDRKLLNKPVLSVWMPNNHGLIIDGSHRYMARVMLSLNTVDHLLVPYPAWLAYAEIKGKPLFKV